MPADAEKVHLVRGLGFCRGSGRVKCGTALLWAAARSRSAAGVPSAGIYSFAQRFAGEEI